MGTWRVAETRHGTARFARGKCRWDGRQFGKQIQTQALPEWASHYMNYKALKKIIKAQEARRASPRTVGAAGDAGAAGGATGTGKDDEQPFLNYVDREVEKVGERPPS